VRSEALTTLTMKIVVFWSTSMTPCSLVDKYQNTRCDFPEDSNFHLYLLTMSIPMAARCKAWVCGRWLAGIPGSNPVGGMDVSCECCVLSDRGLCEQADNSSRGVLPSVVCLGGGGDHEASIMRGPWPTRGCEAMGGGWEKRNKNCCPWN
jgi:hypothetical protein